MPTSRGAILFSTSGEGGSASVLETDVAAHAQAGQFRCEAVQFGSYDEAKNWYWYVMYIYIYGVVWIFGVACICS